MAEGPAGEQRGGSMDTEQDLLLQQEQSATVEYQIISSPGSSRGPASLSPAATAAPAPGAKKSGYISEHGYLMELSRQERRRIEQEIKKRFKPGLTVDNVRKALHGIPWREVSVMLYVPHSKLSEIEGEYRSDEEREVAVIRYWILRDPFASWRRIIQQLENWRGHDHAITLYHYSEELTDSSLTHSNLAAVLETVEVEVLEVCFRVPDSVQEKLEQQCGNDEEYRNELISWWLQYSPTALDSWKWLSGRLLFFLGVKESALAAAKRYVHQTPDPTLTLNNVTAIMKDVQEWDDVAEWIGIPISKRLELQRQNPTTDKVEQAYWDYWLHHYAARSWRILADGLYVYKEHGALEVLQMNYLKGTSESRRLFEVSMKFGFVDASVDKMLFHGSAGVGKTCTMNIVAGEKTPEARHSTPIATRPISIFQMLSSKEIWLKYTSEQRLKICAWLSKLGLGPELIEALKQEAATPALDPTSEEGSNQEGSGGEQVQSPRSPDATALQPEQSAVQVTEQHADRSSIAVQPSTASVDPNVIKVIQEVLDKMFELIDKCSESEDPISFLRKVLITDCGGQPQFHEILPIFLKRMSMIVFVIKLSEELSSRPMIEYYENGKALGTPYESDLTTEQLLQQGLRSLHSHRSSKDKGDDAPQIVVVGTHKDEEGKCKESREAKNQKLREMLLPTFKDEIVYYQAATNDILFPMNARCPGQEEEDMAQVVRNRVRRSNSRRIPLPWMALEIVLDEITHVLQRGLLHKNECLEVARRLHFDESTLEAALMYLDELSLILYCPDILPDLVFTNPQVLLDKVSELVKVHHDLMKRCGDKAWQEFFNHALVTVEFLSQEDFDKHYVPGLFLPENLVVFCRKLFIFANYSEGKFFVPCLLRMLGRDDVSKYRLSHDYHLTPLVLHFTDGPPRRGIFCALLCFLTSPENHFLGPWKLNMPSGSVTPTCLHRNCIQFIISGVKVPCTVTLIDTLLQFEVHVKVSKQAACKVCPTIKHAITAGLQKANVALGYTNSTPSFAFLCPCGAGEPHPATIGDGFWICTSNQGEGDEFSPNQQLWLDGDDLLEEKSGSSPTMAELLHFRTGVSHINIPREVGTKYHNLGVQLLHESFGYIRSLERELDKNAERINCQIFQEWLDGKGRKPTSWVTVVGVLNDIEMGELASKIETSLNIHTPNC